MKGATVGGAIASLQHPNYIVNQENATADVDRCGKNSQRNDFSIEIKERIL